MKGSTMEDPQIQEEDATTDEAKQVNKDLKSSEDTKEEGKWDQYHSDSFQMCILIKENFQSY